MAVTPGVNSYGSNAEFLAYANTRVGGIALIDTIGDTDNIENEDVVLVSAFNQIEAVYTYEWELTDTGEIPDNVKKAQFEVAFGIIQNDSISNHPTDDLKSLKAGSVQLVFDPDGKTEAPLFTEFVLALLGAHGTVEGRTGLRQIMLT